MSAQTDKAYSPRCESGLRAFIALAKFRQVPADEAQLRHQFTPCGEVFDALAMQRAANALGLRVKCVNRALSSVEPRSLPAIAKDKNGEYFLLLKIKLAKNDTDKRTSEYLVQKCDQRTPSLCEESELESIWSGELVLVAKSGLSGAEALKQFDISWFVPALVKYRKLFGEVLLASVIIQLFALITPLFFQVVMDKVLVHRGFTTLDVLAIGFIAVIVFEALLGGTRQYILAHTTHRVDVDLGARLYKHLIALPQAWFEQRQVGQSVARVRELDTLRNFITGTAMTLTIDLSFTFIFFAVLYLYSPLLTVIVLGSLPLYVLLSFFITPILRKRLEQKFQYGAQNQAFLVESINGIQTVKSMAVEPQMQHRWEEQLAKSVTSTFRAGNVSNVAGQLAAAINKLTTLLIIWVGAHLVISGKLSVGQLVAFNMIAGRVSSPILKLVQLWQDFQQAGISIRRLGDILNTPTETGYDPGRSTLPVVTGHIEFEHVRFRYRVDGPVILEDISLSVAPGEIIGVVGRSGSGKSTLTKLIQRLYVPENGRVLVDKADLADIDTAWLRGNVGVVLQENFLFNRSVRENIALINPALEMSKIVEAAKLAGAHDFIMGLPKSYDTLIDENGCNLSGGQRQRIAIARALVGDPRILIFDEATSALDYESERIIQENMSKMTKGRTVFVIAHRLSAVRYCDRIIVMDKGRIVEEGDHQQLIKLGGLYSGLYRLQELVATTGKTPAAESRPKKIRTTLGLEVRMEDGRAVIGNRDAEGA